MLKLRVTYSDSADKDKLINELDKQYRILNVSKEYPGKGKSLYKNTYIDLSDKQK